MGRAVRKDAMLNRLFWEGRRRSLVMGGGGVKGGRGRQLEGDSSAEF